MKLNFNSAYKSVEKLPIAELPSFTVLTGANGSGKTHLMQAIQSGGISIEGVSQQRIRYYDWRNMIPEAEQSLVPNSLIKSNLGQSFTKLSSGALLDVLTIIESNVGLKLDKEHLLGCIDNKAPFTDLDQDIQDRVRSYLDDYNKCVLSKLEQGLTNDLTVEFVNAEPNRRFNYSYVGSVGKMQVSTSLDKFSCSILLDIIKSDFKPFFDINESDCIKFFPLIQESIDPFQGSLVKLFAAYIRERERNDLNRVRFERGDAESFFTNDEFIENFGLPPWQVINNYLSLSKLPFYFEKPSVDANRPVEIKLRHSVSNVDIKFGDLSSGEKILISIAQFLFLSKDKRQVINVPNVILLDEIDAPLHPSMVADLLHIITHVMVEEYKIEVIMVTHSPSTVALAPEGSIHIMNAETKLITKATIDEGVRALTIGVPTLSIDINNRRQVFVESLHDVYLYERIAEVARPHLIPSISLLFMAAGHEKNGGCALLISLVKQLNNAGNKAVFGVVDWDGERKADGNLRVLGENMRHSIENYLLDPVLIGALLLREKSKVLHSAIQQDMPILEGVENYFDLRNFNNERLQRVANAVFISLGMPLENLVQVSYINGRIVQVPQEYLLTRGHDLENRIRLTFEELKRFHQEPLLKKEVLNKILEDMPELLPKDFIVLLTDIQTR